VSLIRFEIRYPNGRKEVMTLETQRALIGSGAHCDIRLPVDQASAEAVAVEVVGDTVRVEAKSHYPPATINGALFTAVPLPPDVPVRIGAVSVFIALERELGGAATTQKNASGVSAFTKVIALLGLAGAAYMALDTDDAPAPPAPAQTPNLFVAAPAACPQTSPDQALSLANEKFDIAEGKRERSPFAPREGVQAVQLYELAGACFRQARDAARAADADTSARQLQEAITQDFRARRIRLEHLMAAKDYELAGSDAAVLSALTEGQQGPWVTWLADTSRTLKQKGPKK
jgi:hypothetical protein